MIKPMECPRCGSKMHFDDQSAWNEIAHCLVSENDWCEFCKFTSYRSSSRTKTMTIVRWNAHCRRELRLMKKEEKEK